LNVIIKDILGDYQVDVLINNAYDMGVNTGFGNAGKATDYQWTASFECINWTRRLVEAFGSDMCSHGEGSIINISSMYSIVSPDPELYKNTDFNNPITYSVAKAAIDAMTRRYAALYGPRGVRVNSILPGPFPKPEVSTDQVFSRRLLEKTLLKRVGVPRELIGTIVWLSLDNASSFVTGQSISVDGGWTVV